MSTNNFDEYQQNKVENIKREELVKRSPIAKKLYLRGEYCKVNKKYELNDYDDISRTIYVKKGTNLFLTWDSTNEKEF
jgi:hypothetical protein